MYILYITKLRVLFSLFHLLYRNPAITPLITLTYSRNNAHHLGHVKLLYSAAAAVADDDDDVGGGGCGGCGYRFMSTELSRSDVR